MVADKTELRAKMRRFLRAIDPQIKRSWDEAIGKNLAQFLKNRKGPLGVYAPFGDEVDWTKGEWHKEMSLLFPEIESESEMSFHSASLQQLVTKVVFGFKLKMPPQNPGQSPVVPAVVVVPGLAFSKTGARLGRGRGYFDRYLAKHRPVAVGVAYEGQLVEDLPADPTDWPMNFVVTEKSIYDCASERNRLRRMP